MANPCGPSHLPSQPNPAHANTVVFTALALGSYLNNKGMGWAYGIAPALGTLTYDLPSFCAADPPALPAITAADVAGWFNPLNPQGAAQLRQAMGDLVGFYLWYDLCECASGPALLAPGAVAAPAGLETNPPALTPGRVPTRCGTMGDWIHGPPINSGDSTLMSTGLPAIPGVTSAHITWFVLQSGIGTPRDGNIVFNVLDYAGHNIGLTRQVNFFAAGTTGSQDIEMPEGAFYIQPVITTIGGASAAQVTVAIDVFCDGQVQGAPAQPCCPPDPVLEQLVSQILSSVTLLQRQLVPFAYIDATVHAGLVDQGSFAVADDIGVKINLTTIPASYGREVGSPEVFFDLGWVSILTADGLIDQRRVTAQTQVWMPRLFGEAITVGYSFSPGVVATLTELVREP